MVSDWETWACADQMLRKHGAGADMFLSERIKALAEAGDTDGVATWRAIADRVDRLRDNEGADILRH